MKTNTITCPVTNQTFTKPKRLLSNTRNLANRYRYRGPFGDKDITSKEYANWATKEISLKEAIDFALQLNEKFYGESISLSAIDPVKKAVARSDEWVTQHVNEFIKLWDARHPEELNAVCWDAQERRLRRFATALNEYNPADIDNTLLQKWFHAEKPFTHLKATHHTQSTDKQILNKFFANYASVKNIFPSCNYLAFLPMSRGGLRLIEEPAKQRQPWELGEYELVMEKAIEITNSAHSLSGVRNRTLADLNWFINLWSLGRLTGLRESDLIGICFDLEDCSDPEGEPKYWDKVNNRLVVTIGKSKRQRKKSRPQVNTWDLSSPKHAALLAALEACAVTRYQVNTTNPKFQSEAKTLIHKRPVMCKASKTKIHYSAVTNKEVQLQVDSLRSFIPRIEALASGEKPTFHELRALFVLDKWNEKEDLEVIARYLGHTNLRVLLGHYAPHINWNEVVIGGTETGGIMDADYKTRGRAKLTLVA